jgi:hypothetical protein
VVHDYVAFYFGYLSPMMLQLKTGQVAGYDEGQEPLVYLCGTVQAVCESDSRFVFSNGHGISRWTEWKSEVGDLGEVDWEVVNLRYWKDTIEDMNRQSRKQAEFLVHRHCRWSLIGEIVVMTEEMRQKVLGTLAGFAPELRRQVHVRRDWYYWD